MKPKTAVWLGYIALALALIALAIRIARGRVDDWTDFIGPVAIALMIISVISRERKKIGSDRG